MIKYYYYDRSVCLFGDYTDYTYKTKGRKEILSCDVLSSRSSTINPFHVSVDVSFFLFFYSFFNFHLFFGFCRSFDDCIVLIICVSWILNYLLRVSDCVVIHFLIIIRVEKVRVNLASSRPLLYYDVQCDERMKV